MRSIYITEPGPCFFLQRKPEFRKYQEHRGPFHNLCSTVFSISRALPSLWLRIHVPFKFPIRISKISICCLSVLLFLTFQKQKRFSLMSSRPKWSSQKIENRRRIWCKFEDRNIPFSFQNYFVPKTIRAVPSEHIYNILWNLHVLVVVRKCVLSRSWSTFREFCKLTMFDKTTHDTCVLLKSSGTDISYNI